jgi:hypothetical protein
MILPNSNRAGIIAGLLHADDYSKFLLNCDIISGPLHGDDYALEDPKIPPPGNFRYSTLRQTYRLT